MDHDITKSFAASEKNGEAALVSAVREGKSSSLEELHPAVRPVLELRETEERSAGETANLLGISDAAAESPLLRAHRTLREKLNSFLRKVKRCPIHCAVTRLGGVATQGYARRGERENPTLLTISKAIVVSLLFTVPIAAGRENLDYTRIYRDGCSVQRLDDKVWRAYVWADYQDGAQEHDFSLWLSERSNRWKAMKDCDDWLTTADKKRSEATKTKTAARQGRAAD